MIDLPTSGDDPLLSQPRSAPTPEPEPSAPEPATPPPRTTACSSSTGSRVSMAPVMATLPCSPRPAESKQLAHQCAAAHIKAASTLAEPVGDRAGQLFSLRAPLASCLPRGSTIRSKRWFDRTPPSLVLWFASVARGSCAWRPLSVARWRQPLVNRPARAITERRGEPLVAPARATIGAGETLGAAPAHAGE